MTQHKVSHVERWLRRLSDAIYRYPRLFFYPQAMLFLACLCYTVLYLQFNTSRNDLVGQNQRYHKNYLRFKELFPSQDEMVVVVESESPEKNRQFVERLGQRLDQETNLFTDVFYKGDLKMMGNKALLFLPDQELVELQKTLEDFRPFINNFGTATNLISLFNLINRQFAGAKRELNDETKAMLKALPALERILAQARDSLLRQGTPVSPGVNALFGGGPEAESRLYITFANGRIYLVTARPPSLGVGEESIRRMRQLIHQTQIEVPGVNVGFTGELVLEMDEMAQSQSDTTIATLVSLVLCALIFIYGYSETGRPIKATLTLLVGVAYTMAFTTFTVGHLNILTITFVPILIGLAIDFGVHLASRFEEELRHHHSPRYALRKALVFTGQGVFTGAFTTAGAFFAMGITDFQGIREMGIICGGGLLLCLVPMMTLLPVLLLRGRQNVMDRELATGPDTRERWERIWLSRPWTVLVLTLILCGLAARQCTKVAFDYNLLHMQSHGLPAVECEKKLIDSAGKSVLYAAVIASDIEHAMQLEERLKKLPSVASVESLAPYLAADQRQKLPLIGAIRREAATIRFADHDPGPVRVDDLSATLWSLRGYLGLASEEAAKEDPALARSMENIRTAIQNLRKTMLAAEPVSTAAKLGAYQRAFFEDVHETFQALRQQDNRDTLKIEDLPPALYNRFIGKNGSLLLQVYPKKDVWEREPQEEFVAQLRSVNPDVTGTPVQMYEYTMLLKNSYLEAAKYSLIAIAIMIFIHFRSITCVLLALLPVAIGTLWMLGIMALFKVMFNPANIITLPLAIGIGVTNGIHVLNRFAEENHPSIFARSTGKAVLVSGLTTIAGFGSLMLGQHQGITSLGFVMSIGVATCMIAGVTCLPAILSLLHRRGWSIKKTQ